MKKIKAFTLTEVMMSLFIIGIILMIAMPVYVKQAANRETFFQLRKFYPIMDNVLDRIRLEHMGMENAVPVGTEDFTASILPLLRVGETCRTDPIGNCWIDNDSGDEDSTLNNDELYYKFKLVDGTAIAMKVYQQCDGSESINVVRKTADGVFDYSQPQDITDACIKMYVDVNAEDGPNKWGEDRVSFVYSVEKGFIPASEKAVQVIHPEE